MSKAPPTPFPLAAVEGLSLRPATAADRDFLWRLHLATFRDYVVRTWNMPEAEHEATFDAAFARELPFHQIVGCDGRDVGDIAIERHGDHLFLDYIAILPDAARRGIGTRLIKAVQRQAGHLDQALQLSVLNVNPARRLYERLGFVVTGRDELRTRMQWRRRRAAA